MPLSSTTSQTLFAMIPAGTTYSLWGGANATAGTMNFIEAWWETL
jgi:hypothetical protein